MAEALTEGASAGTLGTAVGDALTDAPGIAEALWATEGATDVVGRETARWASEGTGGGFCSLAGLSGCGGLHSPALQKVLRSRWLCGCRRLHSLVSHVKERRSALQLGKRNPGRSNGRF